LVCGLGCIPSVCEEESSNEILGCEGKVCGTYDGLRHNGERAQGVDLKCNENSVVVAPFDGNLSFWRPIEKPGSCHNEGARISGIGQWQGYEAYIAPLLLDFFGGPVKKGDRIGVAKNYGCFYNVTTSPHIRFNLQREKQLIDPTYHLKDCMCTGQICETNIRNSLSEKPFHYSFAYNDVYGWSINCDIDSERFAATGELPKIYSPIDADWIGNIRWCDTLINNCDECENNGIVLRGKDKWNGYGICCFEVRLYNVIDSFGIVSSENETADIKQGDVIGTRLNCNESPDIVFMEVLSSSSSSS
uniref:Peptidase_M23 domain-containing protein n=1 Tax=Syphacia muris TaxID=451379 RepID=A0A0N5AVN7_9BILA